MNNNIYCTVWKDSNCEPFRILPTNFERGKDDYILGVKANMVICIVNKDNHQIYDMPAPEELRVYANEVKEFMKTPFWKMKLRRYFDTPITFGEDADII